MGYPMIRHYTAARAPDALILSGPLTPVHMPVDQGTSTREGGHIHLNVTHDGKFIF